MRKASVEPARKSEGVMLDVCFSVKSRIFFNLFGQNKGKKANRSVDSIPSRWLSSSRRIGFLHLLSLLYITSLQEKGERTSLSHKHPMQSRKIAKKNRYYEPLTGPDALQLGINSTSLPTR